MNIGIFIYPDAEVLDFSGPFEVFSTANRLSSIGEPFVPLLIAETLDPVAARGGYSVNPRCTMYDHPPLDVLIVAGGVHTEVMKNTAVTDWVAHIARNAQLVASVCTGAFVLAEAGLLRGLSATTHWEDIPELKSGYPDVAVIEQQRWVDQGQIVTSGGISAGIDMSLHLVARLTSVALAERTARQMEFDWRHNAED